MGQPEQVGSLLVPTAVQFLAGASLYLLFRAHPGWSRVRSVRVGALVAILLALLVYTTHAIEEAGSLAGTVASVLLVVVPEADEKTLAAGEEFMATAETGSLQQINLTLRGKNS